MIEGPGVWWRFHEDDVTRQQVRPGTARRVWPYLRRYRGPMVLLVLITVVDAAIVVTIPLILRLIIDDGSREADRAGRAVGGGQDDDHAPGAATVRPGARGGADRRA